MYLGPSQTCKIKRFARIAYGWLYKVNRILLLQSSLSYMVTKYFFWNICFRKQQFLVRYFVKNFKSVHGWTLYCYSQFLQNMRQVFNLSPWVLKGTSLKTYPLAELNISNAIICAELTYLLRNIKRWFTFKIFRMAFFSLKKLINSKNCGGA